MTRKQHKHSSSRLGYRFCISGAGVHFEAATATYLHSVQQHLDSASNECDISAACFSPGGAPIDLSGRVRTSCITATDVYSRLPSADFKQVTTSQEVNTFVELTGSDSQRRSGLIRSYRI